MAAAAKLVVTVHEDGSVKVQQGHAHEQHVTSACIDVRTTAAYSEQAHCKRTIGQQPNAFLIAHLS